MAEWITIAPVTEERKKTRVAAYARVSTDKDTQQASFHAQIAYYQAYIATRDEWQFAGMYADEGISGTSMKNREGMKKMLADCEKGKIDRILTKSISRFARNTVDLLRTVRNLKAKGIAVYFERERIDTLSGEGELLLSILASFAQEESRSISQNLKWTFRKNFAEGKYLTGRNAFGYRWIDGVFEIQKSEAEIVRLIYTWFLEGMSLHQIAVRVREKGFTGLKGKPFTSRNVTCILENEIYTGNRLLQKQYTDDSVTHRLVDNHGELPQYWVENTHDPIIPLDLYLKAKKELERRRSVGFSEYEANGYGLFTSNIQCRLCGLFFARWNGGKNVPSAYWHCRSQKHGSKYEDCGAPKFTEDFLYPTCCKALGIAEWDGDLFQEEVHHISVDKERIYFHFHSGNCKDFLLPRISRLVRWSEEYRREWGAYQQYKIRTGEHINFATYLERSETE